RSFKQPASPISHTRLAIPAELPKRERRDFQVVAVAPRGLKQLGHSVWILAASVGERLSCLGESRRPVVEKHDGRVGVSALRAVGAPKLTTELQERGELQQRGAPARAELFIGHGQIIACGGARVHTATYPDR